MKLPIIGMGGIATVEDALEFIIAGATAVQVGTANFVDPFIWTKILDGLDAYLDAPSDLARVTRPRRRRRIVPGREARVDRILVALDVASAREALALADTLRGAVGGYKIGSQLFTAAGPDVVRALVERGDRVFLDLKFHDIPNTVAGAVAARRPTSACGWSTSTPPAGGRCWRRRGRRPTRRPRARRARPLVIAVTVLTSLDAATLASVGVDASPLDQVVRLAELAQAAGLDGVVASPQETAAIRRACGSDFLIVTPGIRGGQRRGAADDQQRTLTPAGAIAAGSSYLVIGRPITAAADPRAAARAIAEEVQLLRGKDEVPAAVLLPAGLASRPARGLLFAHADDVDAGGRDAQADEVVADGCRAALAQGQVVLVRASRVGVPFDRDASWTSTCAGSPRSSAGSRARRRSSPPCRSRRTRPRAGFFAFRSASDMVAKISASVGAGGAVAAVVAAPASAAAVAAVAAARSASAVAAAAVVAAPAAASDRTRRSA